MKAKVQTDGEGRFGAVLINCPGCGDRHALPVRTVPAGYVESPYYAGGAHWDFNGSLEQPTFSPSLLIRSGHYATEHKPGDSCWCTYRDEEGEPAPFACVVCHSFIRDGRIEFLNDCTHALAGQTVDLPPVDAEQRV